MNIDGVWKPISIKLAGSEFDAAAMQAMELAVKGEDIITVTNGQTEKGKLKLNPGTSPISLDIVILEGPNIGKVTQAIIRLKDDNLMICYSLQKGIRPTEFTSTPENKYFLVVYKKVK